VTFSEQLLAEAADLRAARLGHPFVTELADGTLDEAAFRRWLEQDYRYLEDLARAFAVAAGRAHATTTARRLIDVARATFDHELDRLSDLAGDYGRSRDDLRSAPKTPTCTAYTAFLLRTAHEGTAGEFAAAVVPCEQGFLDVVDDAARRADDDNPYRPWIEMYADGAFDDVVDAVRGVVDRHAEQFPGTRERLRDRFLTGARFEHQFLEMAYAGETWAAGSSHSRPV
jgi:thiaminase/transcriptional activator TenA